MSNCPDCGTELTSVKGRRSGKRFLWCWKCERSMRPGEARAAAPERASHLSAVPTVEVESPYGWVEYLTNTTKPPQRLTIGVRFGDDDPGTDIVLGPNGRVLKHPYDGPRESTEDERAAVGWTW